MRHLGRAAALRLIVAFLPVAALAVVADSLATALLPVLEATAHAQGAQTQRKMETHDDLLVRVEERVPGFGGMFIDADKRLVVYLLDTARLAAARQAIEAVFGPQRVPPAGVRAVRGQYTVSQLKSWTERANAILEMPGVTMVDLDETKNRVGIGVEDHSRMKAIEQALSSLNIPREAVIIQVTGQIRPIDRRPSR
jgi:hypothetical protein